MIVLQLGDVNDNNINVNSKDINDKGWHTVDKYLSWESAAKMLAEKINTDSMDTENFFVRFVEDK